MQGNNANSPDMSDHQSVMHRFSAAAGAYDALASVQEQVAATLAARWKRLPAPRHILEIGCGTGKLTRRLSEQYPHAHIHAIDISARMIRTALAACGSLPRISWETTDLLELPTTARFDLVASASSLHWVAPFPAAIRQIAAVLVPGGYLSASIMIEGTLKELHEARRAAAPAKPPRTSLPSREIAEMALDGSGFDISDLTEEAHEKHYPTAQALLEAIHRQGLTGGGISSAGTPLTRGELETLKGYYSDTFTNPAGGVSASYRVLYITAEKRA